MSAANNGNYRNLTGVAPRRENVGKKKMSRSVE